MSAMSKATSAFVSKALMLKLWIWVPTKAMWGSVGGVFFHLEQDHASFPQESHATQLYIASWWGIKSFSVLWVVFEGDSFCLERMLPKHLNTDLQTTSLGPVTLHLGLLFARLRHQHKLFRICLIKNAKPRPREGNELYTMNQQMRHLSLIILSVVMSVYSWFPRPTPRKVQNIGLRSVRKSENIPVHNNNSCALFSWLWYRGDHGNLVELWKK